MTTLPQPRLEFYSKDQNEITVRHHPPAVAGTWDHSTIFMVGSLGVSAQADADVLEDVTIIGLTTDMTYRVYAVGVSATGELSLPTDAIAVDLKSIGVPDLSASFVNTVPPLNCSKQLPHEGVAAFLEAVGFGVQGDEGAEEKCGVGKNVFVDYLPAWYYEDSDDVGIGIGSTLVTVALEPSVYPGRADTHNQKQTASVTVTVNNGSRDLALLDAKRLYNFFLRRENVLQFTVCGLSVRLIKPSATPSFVGVDDSSRAVYNFRLFIRYVTTRS